MEQSKRCPTCGETLPAHSFYRNRSRADGLGSQCQSCVRAATKARKGEPRRQPKAYRDEHGKTCPRCTKYKPWTEYRKNVGAGDGHQSYCQPCCYLYEKESDERNAEAVQLRWAEKLARTPDPALRKVCRKCGEEKPLLEFYAHRHTADGRMNHCRACAAEYGRQWNANNKDKQREYNRRQRADPKRKRRADMQKRALHLKMYGLTPETHDALLAAQGGVCAICHEPGQVWAERNLHVDHDHETNEVRGLLCGRCNVGLGFFREDTDRMLRAIEYLKNPPAVT